MKEFREGQVTQGNGVITQDGLNIRKIDDFMTKIGKLQVETEVIKTDSNSFQFLKDLNGKLKLIKNYSNFYW